jgi:hypothetical protein
MARVWWSSEGRYGEIPFGRGCTAYFKQSLHGLPSRSSRRKLPPILRRGNDRDVPYARHDQRGQ